MGELGDQFREWREHKKQKKQQNLKNSITLLEHLKVPYQKLGEHHLRVGEYDFWPSTGMFIHVKTGKKGRGVMTLLNRLSGNGNR